jgi:FKBP-type peptidyl-prolyl cis-trans isomerase 2
MSDVTAVPLRPVGKSGIVALWTGVALFLAGGAYAAYVVSERPAMSVMTADQFMAANARRWGVQKTASGIEYQVIKAGNGPKPTSSDIAIVDYKGTLTNGTPFDASQPGHPAKLPVAAVVPGFSEALMLMPKGATYRFWIPPQLAYGPNDNGPIPGNSVLVFDLTLEDIEAITPEMIQRMQMMQQMQQQQQQAQQPGQ